MFFRKDDRHPGVDLPYKLVRFAGDDCACAQPLVICRIFPAFPLWDRLSRVCFVCPLRAAPEFVNGISHRDPATEIADAFLQAFRTEDIAHRRMSRH
jgi:hypothetical protein